MLDWFFTTQSDHNEVEVLNFGLDAARKNVASPIHNQLKAQFPLRADSELNHDDGCVKMR